MSHDADDKCRVLSIITDYKDEMINYTPKLQNVTHQINFCKRAGVDPWLRRHLIVLTLYSAWKWKARFFDSLKNFGPELGGKLELYQIWSKFQRQI